MDSLIGQTLGGKYKIIKELGRGGMAAVFLAEQAGMKRQVAIKVLPKEFSYDETYSRRFQQEAEAIASLTHPHILPVHDYGADDGWTYIVMTYLDGGSLTDVIRERREGLPLEQVARILEQVSAALDYASQRNIIHRDVKPGNIMLDEQGNAYLTDFGISKLTESTAQLTGSGIVGTPAYMAPEMASTGGLTSQIDVYALGVTLFQMLAGQMPFTADTPLGVIMAHTTQPVPMIAHLRKDLPEDMQLVLDRALAKQPLHRYQSAGALAGDFAAVLRGESVFDLEAYQAEHGTMQMGMGKVDSDTQQAPVGQPTQPGPPQPGETVVAEKSGINPLWIVAGIAAIVLVVGGLGIGLVLNAISGGQRADLDATSTAFAIAAVDSTVVAEQATQDTIATATADIIATEQAVTTATAAPQVTAEARSILFESGKGWEAVVEEGFSDNEIEWFTVENYSDELADATFRVEDGVYRWFLQANDPIGVIWSEPRPVGLVTEQFALTLDATRLDGPREVFYGVIFRYVNAQNYYVFMICDNGCINATRVKEGLFTTLYSDVTGAVRPGEANTLTVIGDHGYFALYVNQKFAGEFTDETFSTGGIGVAGELFEQGTSTRLEFDNLVIREP